MTPQSILLWALHQALCSVQAAKCSGMSHDPNHVPGVWTHFTHWHEQTGDCRSSCASQGLGSRLQ